eukprot:scaffold2636_cov340-Pavlova_lutheri.AAC.74
MRSTGRRTNARVKSHDHRIGRRESKQRLHGGQSGRKSPMQVFQSEHETTFTCPSRQRIPFDIEWIGSHGVAPPFGDLHNQLWGTHARACTDVPNPKTGVIKEPGPICTARGNESLVPCNLFGAFVGCL